MKRRKKKNRREKAGREDKDQPSPSLQAKKRLKGPSAIAVDS